MSSENIHGYAPDVPSAPGETLSDWLEENSMAQKELSTRMGVTEKFLSQLIHGKAPIRPETATKLQRVTGIPSAFWMQREATYRNRLEQLDAQAYLADNVDWLKDVPTAYLRKLGLVQANRKGPEQLREVLEFFSISKIDNFEEYWEGYAATTNMAARKSPAFETNIKKWATWLRLGQKMSSEIDCAPYSKTRFAAAVERIRELTVLSPPEFYPQMKALCADCGVAFVVVPEVSGVPWNGACWWDRSSRAVIQLNLRGKREDKFWFSFFHEAGHILKGHSRKTVYIADKATEGDPLETEANIFAQDILIPPESRSELACATNSADIRKLAKSIGVSPGIVAGQYEHMTGQWYLPWIKRLITKYEWINQS
jgi:HTH-type transcriptional regulator/antitoxin HigA